jgi:hypothetical protein
MCEGVIRERFCMGWLQDNILQECILYHGMDEIHIWVVETIWNDSDRVRVTWRICSELNGKTQVLDCGQGMWSLIANFGDVAERKYGDKSLS